MGTPMTRETPIWLSVHSVCPSHCGLSAWNFLAGRDDKVGDGFQGTLVHHVHLCLYDLSESEMGGIFNAAEAIHFPCSESQNLNHVDRCGFRLNRDQSVSQRPLGRHSLVSSIAHIFPWLLRRRNPKGVADDCIARYILKG